MKKFLIMWVSVGITMAVLGLINAVVLLHFHPKAYYYTPDGMLLNAALAVIEGVMLTPAIIHFYKKLEGNKG